jgi:DNA repair exonuclease SbcCD nuclease subunit
MKILIIGDTHHTEGYLLEHSINYLNDIKKVIRKEKPTLVVHLGDMFNTKETLSKKVIDIFKDEYTEIAEMCDGLYVISGNHDFYYHNRNDYSSISILKGIKNIKTIQKECHIVTENFHNCQLVFAPYITDDAKFEIAQTIKEYNKPENVLFGHLELRGFNLNDGITVTRSKLNYDYLNKYKKVFIGHIHNAQTIRNMVGVGSAYQTRFGETPNKQTLMYDTVSGVTHEVYLSANLFVRCYIDMAKYKNGAYKQELKDIENKKVEIYFDTDDLDLVKELTNEILIKKPYSLDVKNKTRDFTDINILKKLSINELEKEYFDQFFKHINKGSIKQNIITKFYDLKNRGQQNECGDSE